MKIVDRFEIPYYQYLNENSVLADEVPAIAEDTDTLIKLYRLMTLVRIMDAKAIALQRTGKLGTYPSTRGQEAVFVGVGQALHKDDIFVPYYRDMGTLAMRGIPLSHVLLYWGGDERGNDFGSENHDFPYSVPVGSQPLHAAGAAYAVKYHQEQSLNTKHQHARQSKRAVLSMCGDGATSEGDFYEALNVSGVWKLPVVFAICNNQWAISVPRTRQTAAHTLAQKAIAAGFSGEVVDGNDIIAVIHRTSEALKKAREQGEPTLLEMQCYRQHDHTTADDASRYEPKNLRIEEWKKEPLARLYHYLEKKGVWSMQDEEALQAECAKSVEEVVKTYLETPKAPLTSMFDYLYEKLPRAYNDQRDIVSCVEK